MSTTQRPGASAESSTKAKAPMLALLLFAAAGILVFGWLRSKFALAPATGGFRPVRGPAIEVGLALSGGILVAVVVGGLIDRTARERLVEKISEGWMWGLIGKDAPPQLQVRAKQILANRIVLSRHETRLQVDWVDAKHDALRITIKSLIVGTNFGPDPFQFQPQTQVVPSIPGHESKMTRWEFEVFPNDAASRSGHVLFGPESFEGRTKVLTEATGDKLKIPSELRASKDDGFRLLRCAEVVLPARGTLPLSTSYPSVDQTLDVSGAALDDLKIVVVGSHDRELPEQSGVDALVEPDVEPSKRYSRGATLAGEWLWFCWEEKQATDLTAERT